MDTVKPRPTTWLVRDLIPDGDLTVLIGEEGIGKGLWWTDIAARLTRQGHKGLLICGEDDYERTVRPRLDVAGADTSLIATIVRDQESLTGQPIFPTNTLEVEAAIREHGFRWVIIDPWISTVSSQLAVKDTQSARQALDPLMALARRTEVAILAVAHPNRGEGSLRDRVGLTAALRQTARVLIFALEDPEDNTRLYVGVEKANGSSRGPASLYAKRPAEHRDVGQVWRVETLEDDTGLTIREWDAAFHNAKKDDGRTTDRWTHVVVESTKHGMEITRQQVIEIYRKAGAAHPEKAADKAIARWLGSGTLVRQAGGRYQVKPD
jgi:hypothetical protein